MIISIHTSSFFFFNDTATTEIYTLSLHDALPILRLGALRWYWNEHRFAEQYPRVRLLPLCLQHGWDAQKAGSIRKQSCSRYSAGQSPDRRQEIGRASCRERV